MEPSVDDLIKASSATLDARGFNRCLMQGTLGHSTGVSYSLTSMYYKNTCIITCSTSPWH